MNKTNIAGIAIAAILGAAVAGYQVGAGTGVVLPAQSFNATATQAAEPTPRVVLYWKDPDGKQDFSPVPKKTADGRDWSAPLNRYQFD